MTRIQLVKYDWDMMHVFEKLQLKDHSVIVVLDAPASFEPEIDALDNVRVHRAVPRAAVSFALAFVTTQANVDAHAKALAKRAEGDAAIWFAYPKGSSKRYKSDLKRDNSWQVLGDLGFEPVRMVAIDEDWSALRFRRAEFIKTMKRDASHALSKAGKARAKKRQ
jgi:hypothetical protein